MPPKASKNPKPPEKKKQDRPKNPDGGLNPCKDKDKKGKEKTKCTYCQKGWNPEISCMKKTIDMMASLLEKNNTPVPDRTRKKYGSSGSDDKENFHALVVGSSNPSMFIIDSREYRNMSCFR